MVKSVAQHKKTPQLESLSCRLLHNRQHACREGRAKAPQLPVAMHPSTRVPRCELKEPRPEVNFQRSSLLILT